MPEGCLSIPLLSSLPGMGHGFGTRFSIHYTGPVITARQVHGAKVTVFDGPAGGGQQEVETDALVTAVRGLGVGIITADCVPILLACPGGPVAAVHAGWRGTLEGVAARAVEIFATKFGADPQRIAAGLGPAIGPCCYEVGEEILQAFRSKYRWAGDVISGNRLDLPGANRHILIEAGLKPTNISALNLCTKCNSFLFHSYRRDGASSGRQMSYISIKPLP
jgi:YfiH family protein